MVNQSKVNDPRFWDLWKKSGAIGTMYSACQRHNLKMAQELVKEDGLYISAIRQHFAGPAAGCSTLFLGKRVVAEGAGWRACKPVLRVTAPGHNYQLGDRLSRLPEGSEPVSAYFR